MDVVALLEHARARPALDAGGKAVELRLSPGMGDAELADYARLLPCPLPDDVARLLRRCRGFTCGAVAEVDLSDVESFGLDDALPHALPIAGDGSGNFWVVDLQPDSRSFAPIHYACHDPPVIVHQSPTLAHFVAEVLKSGAGAPNTVDDVHDRHALDVWRQNPGVASHADWLQSGDPEHARFAAELDPSWGFVDMRAPAIGFGFSLGRHGPRTEVRRAGARPLFAIRRPPRRRGLLARLLGR